jgi:hypothetical protein
MNSDAPPGNLLSDYKQDWLAARLEELDDGNIAAICAGCKAIVAQRCRLSGMRWLRPTPTAS